MSSYLSEILEIVTEILDTTLKTVTIPDKTVKMEIRPLNVDILFGLASTDINVSGSICTGLKSDGNGTIISISNNAAPLELERASPLYAGGEPLKKESEDLGKRIFYLGSLTSGSVGIVYTKNLA